MKSLILLLVLALSALAEPKVQEGEIGGARYMILSPEKPNGKVLLLAHGYRPKEAVLSAKFDAKGTLETTLSKEGWVIASTSYRRNGWIIEDAIDDIAALQDHVARHHVKPKRTFILGNSMGGQIAALAAEGKLDVDGAIGIGSALQDYPKDDPSPLLNYSPKVPFILLINQEAARPMSERYFNMAGKEFTALWKVERPGHCNTSKLEELAAIRALEEWLDGKEVAREKDATLPVPSHPSTASISLTGNITHISEAWGNITTSFVARDLDTLGVKLKDRFLVQVAGARQEVTLVRHYSEAKQGKGAAYLSPDGYLNIMIRGGNFAAKTGATLSEKVSLSNQ